MPNQTSLTAGNEPFIFPARAIWHEHGTKTEYRHWWARQKDFLGFMEASDFRIELIRNSGTGRPRTEHLLTAKAADILRTHSTAAGPQHTAAKHDALQSVKRLADQGQARIPADQNGPARIASKQVRNELTSLWQTRGKFQNPDFGRVTRKMKSAAGIDQSIPKNQMTTRELVATLAAEQLAADSIVAFDAYGKPMVEAMSIKAAQDVANLLNGPARAAAIASLRKELE